MHPQEDELTLSGERATALAEERRLDAFLDEALRGGDTVELERRIVARLRHSPPLRRTPKFAAAALLLVGATVVAAVAWLQHANEGSAPATQDPERGDAAVVSVTDAQLSEVFVDLRGGVSVDAEILRVCRAAGHPVVVAGDVEGTTRSARQQVPWRQAVALLAMDAAAGVEELGPVLVVRRGAAVTPREPRVDIACDGVSMADLAQRIGLRCGTGIVVAQDLRGTIRCDLKQAHWRTVLDAAAQRLGGEIVGCGSVLVVRRRVEPATGPRATFDAVGIRVQELVDRVAHACGRNVVMNITGTISLSVQEQDPGALLAALARAIDARYLLGDRGIERLELQVPTDAPAVSLTAANADLRTLAELLHSAAAIEIAVPDDAADRLFVSTPAVPLPDLLAAIAAATGRRLDEGEGAHPQIR